MNQLLTVKETAAYLRMPLPTVYYLIQREKLPAIQIGGRWRVKKEDLDRKVLKNAPVTKSEILVVDDEAGVRTVMSRHLTNEGFSPCVVDRGFSAIDAMRTRRFDLLFLDLQLPDITGDRVFDFVRTHTPDTRVVIITGFPDSVMLDRIFQHGPVTVLRKPLRLEQVSAALKFLAPVPELPELV